MIEAILTAGVVIATTLVCVLLALMVYGEVLSRKRDKAMREVTDMYLSVAQLKYRAALDELANDGDCDER